MKHFLILSLFFSLGCAKYQFGQGDRAFPGGYDRIAIPVFVNKTNEVGVESYFTEALRVEFERSELAHVTSKNDAQVIIEGVVTAVDTRPVVQVAAGGQDITTPRLPNKKNPLPSYTVLNKEYVVKVGIHIVARKVSDSQELWSGTFVNERNYFGALLGTPGISNSGPIYNQNYRFQTIARLARDMMSEAHDRITENF